MCAGGGACAAFARGTTDVCLTVASGSGTRIPRKYALPRKISMWRGVRSPVCVRMWECVCVYMGFIRHSNNSYSEICVIKESVCWPREAWNVPRLPSLLPPPPGAGPNLVFS